MPAMYKLATSDCAGSCAGTAHIAHMTLTEQFTSHKQMLLKDLEKLLCIACFHTPLPAGARRCRAAPLGSAASR